MRYRGRLSALVSALVLLAAALPASGQAVVQRVDVQVSVDGPPPHVMIRERLAATVHSVAERLLVGRPLDQLTALGSGLAETIAGVVGRVAGGYAVSSAAVEVGTTSLVTVRLRPVGPLIAGADLAPDLRAVHPRLRDLVGRSLGARAEPELQTLYAALPVGALEWAAPILEARVREAVEASLPGFTAAVQVRLLGDRAQVGLVVLPADTRVVRNIGVRFRSSSIPTMLLDQHGPAVASMAEPLRGLPVAFAQANRAALEELIRAELSGYPPARQYRVVAVAGLDVGETTYVTVVAESLLYRARIEAHLNVGTQAPSPAVVGHLGRLITPRTEAFLELRLVPNTLSLEWQLGAQAFVTPSVTVGVVYAVVAQETILRTSVQVGFDTGVRGSWVLRAQTFEGAVTYRFNEFLSGELVGTSQGDWWLRLVSNL